MGGKAILIVTIGFGFILGYISMNINDMATRAVDNMSHYAAATESHNLAVTGANVGLERFYRDTSWFGTITQEFSGGEETPLGHLTGSFTVSMTNLGGGLARLRSVSTYPVTAYEDYHDTVEVFFDTGKYNSFTLYAYLTDFEGNDDFWVDGDTVWGKAHSNGRFHVNGRPVFMEKVTVTKGFDPKPGVGTNKAVFLGGYETGVAEIDFPVDFMDLINAANPAAGGLGRYYTSDIWVTLSGGSSSNNDGVGYVSLSSGGPNIDTIDLHDGVFNGALVSTGNINVQGTLDGELTMGSLQDIKVLDDVLYQNRDFPNSDDILGLVAESDVIIAETTPNKTNCVIDGSIFCRTGSFFTENINSGSTRGTMTVNGSIVQADKGKIGIYAGSTLKKGYASKYRYDTRLNDPSVRPPFYPGYWVTTYTIANWWESTRIPEYSE